MAIAFVQTKFNSPGGTPATITVTPTSAVTNGNFVVGTITWASTTTTGFATCVKDNNSVAATVLTPFTDVGGPTAISIFYYQNVSGAPTSFTLTIPGGATAISAISMTEWSGVATTSALDASALGDSVPSGPNENTPSATATVAGDLIYATYSGPISGFSTPPTGISFSATSTGATIRNSDSTNQILYDGSGIQTGTGANVATFLTEANTYGSGIALFKAAGAAAAATGGTLPLMGVG